MNMRILSFVFAALFVAVGCTDVQQKVGESYRGWKEGELDIHHIHTGM